MRRLRVWHIAGLAFIALLLTAGWSHAQVVDIKDFSFTQTKDLSPVTFSHQKHAAKNVQCTDCHTKIFQMKRGETTKGQPILVADLMQGKYCGACHNGQKAFAVTDCAKCHLPKP